MNLKPCPFCNGDNIEYSIKTGGIYNKIRKYHVAMYCTDCNCYGKRTLIKITEEDYENRTCSVEKNDVYKKIAIQAWNTRKPIDNIKKQLKDILVDREEDMILDEYTFGEHSAFEYSLKIVKECTE